MLVLRLIGLMALVAPSSIHKSASPAASCAIVTGVKMSNAYDVVSERHSCFFVFFNVISRIVVAVAVFALLRHLLARLSRAKLHPEELVVGDVVVMKPGDAIPADGLLFAGEGVKSNESGLTGEPDDLAKRSDDDCFVYSRCDFVLKRVKLSLSLLSLASFFSFFFFVLEE